jgi:hypothetical protein
MLENKIILTDVIVNEIKNELITKGNDILKNNTFLHDLDKIMNDDNFRLFYNEYYKDFTDVKIVTLYMKLYETIQIEYREKNNCDIDRELLIYIIKNLMDDHTSRKLVLEAFHNYTENKNSKKKRFILDIFNNKINQIKND